MSSSDTWSLKEAQLKEGSQYITRIWTFGLNEFTLLKVSLCFNKNGHCGPLGKGHIFCMVLRRVTMFLLEKHRRPSPSPPPPSPPIISNRFLRYPYPTDTQGNIRFSVALIGTFWIWPIPLICPHYDPEYDCFSTNSQLQSNYMLKHSVLVSYNMTLIQMP